MGEETKIAWTDHTFNPWMGCVKVSDGCKNCYAEALTKNRMGLSLWGANGRRQVTKEPWRNVPRWNRDALASEASARVFCASLADVFEDHPTANETRPASSSFGAPSDESRASMASGSKTPCMFWLLSLTLSAFSSVRSTSTTATPRR